MPPIPTVPTDRSRRLILSRMVFTPSVPIMFLVFVFLSDFLDLFSIHKRFVGILVAVANSVPMPR